MKLTHIQKESREAKIISLEMWRDKVNIIELFKILRGIVKIDNILFICNSIIQDHLKLMEG